MPKLDRQDGALLSLAAVAALAGAGALSRRGSSAIRPTSARRDDVTVQVVGGSSAIIKLYVNGAACGHLQVTRLDDPFDDDANNVVDYECRYDIETLREEMGAPRAPVFVAWRSAIAKAHRGKGYGKLLYSEMLRYLQRQEGHPVILIPEACLEDGSTSPSAYRVWRSLKNTLPWSGEAIYSQEED